MSCASNANLWWPLLPAVVLTTLLLELPSEACQPGAPYVMDAAPFYDAADVPTQSQIRLKLNPHQNWSEEIEVSVSSDGTTLSGVTTMEVWKTSYSTTGVALVTFTPTAPLPPDADVRVATPGYVYWFEELSLPYRADDYVFHTSAGQVAIRQLGAPELRLSDEVEVTTSIGCDVPGRRLVATVVGDGDSFGQTWVVVRRIASDGGPTQMVAAEKLASGSSSLIMEIVIPLWQLDGRQWSEECFVAELVDGFGGLVASDLVCAQAPLSGAPEVSSPCAQAGAPGGAFQLALSVLLVMPRRRRKAAMELTG